MCIRDSDQAAHIDRRERGDHSVWRVSGSESILFPLHGPGYRGAAWMRRHLSCQRMGQFPGLQSRIHCRRNLRQAHFYFDGFTGFKNHSVMNLPQLKRRANLLYRLRRHGITANTKERIIFIPLGEDPWRIPQVRNLHEEFHFNIQFIIAWNLWNSSVI
mgnify:CR=1 FL=1